MIPRRLKSQEKFVKYYNINNNINNSYNNNSYNNNINISNNTKLNRRFTTTTNIYSPVSNPNPFAFASKHFNQSTKYAFNIHNSSNLSSANNSNNILINRI